MAYNNPWELYESMDGWLAAHIALENAWARAARQKTPEAAWRIVANTMRRYSSYGAMDTEPRAELRHRLRKLFPNYDY